MSQIYPHCLSRPHCQSRRTIFFCYVPLWSKNRPDAAPGYSQGFIILLLSTYIGLTSAVTPSTSTQHVERRDANVSLKVDRREQTRGRDRTGGEALRLRGEKQGRKIITLNQKMPNPLWQRQPAHYRLSSARMACTPWKPTDDPFVSRLNKECSFLSTVFFAPNSNLIFTPLNDYSRWHSKHT